MKNKIFGYVRVSSKDQREDRQLIAFKEFGIDERDIYIDKQSGKDFNREQYNILKHILRENDVLVIKSIDRLGRNYDMIIDEWRDLVNGLNVDIYVIDMPLLDTRTEGKNLVGKFISDIVLQILSFVAENERENIKKRQAEGIRIAKEKGKHLGRPKLEIPSNFSQVANQYKKKEITLAEALQSLNMNRSTFYKNLSSFLI